MAVIIYIEDVIKEITANISTVLKMPVYYMHGSLREINARLAQMSQSKSDKAKKFPLVCLLHDYTRSRGDDFESVRISVLIATNTLATYISDQRLEKNFKPVLDPIYQELLRQIHLSSAFNTRSAHLISHTKIDHYFYGTENATNGHAVNRFNDLVDCIEIRDLELNLNAFKCINNGKFKYNQLPERH